jgi:hypothetical protein
MKLQTKILLVILQEMTRIVKCIVNLSYQIFKKTTIISLKVGNREKGKRLR